MVIGKSRTVLQMFTVTSVLLFSTSITFSALLTDVGPSRYILTEEDQIKGYL